MKTSLAIVLALLTTSAPAFAEEKPSRTKEEIVCAMSPSAVVALASTTGAAGGAAVGAAAVAKALGMTVVTHSSGGYILTGSAGYVAGTFVAASTPFVVGGVVVIAGVSAAGVELWCAPKNHPDGYKMVVDKAKELSSQAGLIARKTEAQVSAASANAYSFTVAKVSEWKATAHQWSKSR